MGSSFGTIFRITTFGESHGGGVGVVIDGCPPRLEISVEDIQHELDRRRPGQSKLTTQRAESDRAEIFSGTFEGRTLGTPIMIMVRNEDARASDYESNKDIFRPSHADFTYQAKYGIRSWKGGGRSSARETIGRVAAGAIAKKILAAHGIAVHAWVSRVANVGCTVDPTLVTEQAIEATPVRCPDLDAAKEMIALIERIKSEGDSVGGTVDCVALGVPVGLGEPVFDKLEADLARAMMSLPASKAFEIGSGMDGTHLRGSEHNDEFYMQDDRVRTRTNRSGGVQGGISNGEPVIIRVGFKPTATILRPQNTVDEHGAARELQSRGRHDPCVLPRAVPMVEAMMALVLCDHLLRQIALKGAAGGTA